MQYMQETQRKSIPEKAMNRVAQGQRTHHVISFKLMLQKGKKGTERSTARIKITHVKKDILEMGSQRG
jgi:hypothetical protein